MKNNIAVTGEVTVPMNILDDFIVKYIINESKIIEKHFKIVLQSKPKWLPRFIWNWIISKLLVLQENKPYQVWKLGDPQKGVMPTKKDIKDFRELLKKDAPSTYVIDAKVS